MSSSVTMTLAKQAHPEVAKPPFENMVWIPGDGRAIRAAGR
jgi:hypothetical protein